ncbi:MAG: hypothetical protein K2W82_17965 [Candidatus Obscuribacterales bacterium]|nr:hypothetical protein [Candidatus Obscuribacterales bacterium]
MLRLFTVLLIVMTVIGCSSSGSNSSSSNSASSLRQAPQATAETDKIAQDCLPAVAKFKQLDLNKLTLKKPLVNYFVGLDAVRAWTPGTDIIPLLDPLPELRYPVSNGTVICAYVKISFYNERWQWSETGSTMGVLYTNLRTKLTVQTGLPEEDFFIVSVPGLNKYYLGFRQKGELYLASVLEDRTLGFAVDVPLPAQQVFEKVRQEVQRFDNHPIPNH